MALSLPAGYASAGERALAAVLFEGVSAFDAEQLFPLYADRLGQAPTLPVRIQLRDRTRDYYLSQGYLAPAVRVAPHPAGDDILVVMVAEPRITDTRVNGGGFRQQASVRERVQPLLGHAPISTRTIDRFIQGLAHTLGAGLEIDTEELSPGRHRLSVAIVPRLGGELTYSAEGGQQLGQHLVAGRIRLYSPGGGLDEVYLAGLHTLESAGYRSVGAGVSLSPNGANTLYADIDVSRAVPQDTTSPSRVYRRLWSRLRWRHQVIDASTRALVFDSSVTLRDYTRERGNETEVDERLRMAEAGVLASVQHGSGTSRLGIAGLIGVDAFGAGRRDSRTNEPIDLAFQLISAQYTLWQPLPVGFSMRLDIAGQYSGDNLPYSQRFSAGGTRLTNAYEPGELSGDSGIGTKLELRRGFSDDRWLPGARWVPYVYYGIASTDVNVSDERASAAASGLGVRLLTRQFASYIEFGKPLTTGSEYRDKLPRLTGRLTVYF
ncbi:ShlB/FhaC/HecB family hemolysin secretion/activation protein [Marinobacter sp. X15-166B]|uniref:ShlB/FhaC/HecB family hemolysin secretion/activation protein n=1 Tax=Marinobacter sp. X15-166B TaxID=1897620 RepID=UPI00085C11BB|nr:ShlB/FhaC/HecB family hemolysin secretion/activation protein [Marinobacter sp. X15-166B]OEY65640.1 hypothetical protein BG841_03670 [Marinobacter sp. X15-166B]